jgi:hypothetical protein
VFLGWIQILWLGDVHGVKPTNELAEVLLVPRDCACRTRRVRVCQKLYLPRTKSEREVSRGVASILPCKLKELHLLYVLDLYSEILLPHLDMLYGSDRLKQPQNQ